MLLHFLYFNNLYNFGRSYKKVAVSLAFKGILCEMKQTWGKFASCCAQ